MNKDDLNYLNQIVEDFIFENYECLDNLETIKKLNDYIIETYVNITRIIKHNNRVGISKSYKQVYDFFKSFNDDYADYLKKCWNDNIFQIEICKQKDDLSAVTFLDENDKNAYIYIPADLTLRGSFSITHELIHQMRFGDYLNNSNNFNMFGEALAILSEFLLGDYLINNKYPSKSVNKNKTMIFLGLYNKAFLTNFESYILDTYMKKGSINNYDIIKYVKNSSFYVEKYFNSTVSEFFYNNDLTILYNSRYIIGIFIATYMHDRILNDSKKINEFICINDNLYNMKIEEIFKFLELDIYEENKSFSDFTDDSYKKLFKSYKKEIKNL